MLIIGISLFGCKPPEAPKEYEALVGYIFEHMEDEDPEALAVGLENLDTWLTTENRVTVEEGVTIESLPQTVVDPLAGHEHGTEDLAGVSMLTYSGYGPKVIADALTQYSFKTIIPDVYITYDRDFETGKNCIVERECLWAEATAYTVADWGVLGEVTATRQIQFRWVETEAGWMFLQRWWLTEPSTGSKLDLRIQDQYYIGVNFADSEGTARIHASWLTMEMSTGDASEGAANQLINNWKNDAESLDEWISEQ